jgi:hypothetical protein
MYIGIIRWKKNEWVAFASISLFLGLHLAIVRYPILESDSARYLMEAFFLKSSPWSLGLTSYLLNPLVSLFGIWGFVVFQIAILTYALVSVLKFFNKNFIVGIISIVISLAGYFAISVMMEIYTVVGLLALFLILNGDKDIFLYIIFSICYIAHPENLLLFPLSALIYWAIFNRKSVNFTLLPIIASFIIPIIGVILTNYWLNKEIRFFPEQKYIMLATHIMEDSPEITKAYMEKYPNSEFNRYRDFYEYALTTGDPYNTLLWNKKGFAYNNSIKKEAEGFILYALKYHKFKILNHSLKNTFRFLILPRPGNSLGMMQIDKRRIDKKLLPNQLKYAKNSLQYKGKLLPLSKKLKLIYTVVYYTSILTMLFFISYFLINRKTRDLKYYSFTVFSIIIILINAWIMSNWIGIVLRYQFRVMLIPCLAMSLIVMDLFKGRRYV